MIKKPWAGWLGLGAVILASLACSLSNPTPAAWVLTPTAEAAAAAATSMVLTRAAVSNSNPPELTETPTSAPQPTPTMLSNQLAPQGPWLIYPTDDGRTLMFRNPDSGGQTRVALPDPLIDPGDLVNGMAPGGGWLAVRTGRRDGWADLAIQLIHLPDGSLQRLTPLLSPALQNDNLAIQSVVWRDALRWSPDGKYLAFIAALDGRSSDLYVDDLAAQKIQRLIIGSYQAGTPFWSPDSQWVVTQEMAGLASSDPIAWKIGAVWAINLVTLEFRKLYDVGVDSDGEAFLGWMSSQKMLFYSHDKSGGHDLRQVDIEKIKLTTILAGPFSQIDYDSATQMLVFSRREALSEPAGLSPGLYQIAGEGQEPVLIQGGEWSALGWSALTKTFIASGSQGTLILPPAGSRLFYKNELSGLPAPNLKWQACWGSDGSGPYAGVRLYQPGGQLLQTLLKDPVQDLTWAPDTSGLFALSNSKLYRMTFPDLQPALIEDNVHPGPGGKMVWWVPQNH